MRIPALFRAPFAAVALLALLLAACATGPGTKQESLDRAQYDYSAAVRWNNPEIAFEYIDPARREREPFTEFERERWKQVQVVGYTVVAASPAPDGSQVRDVELRLVNVHTQSERVMRARETWRYDETAQRWWQTDGLPRLDAAR